MRYRTYNGFVQNCPDPATRSKCLADLEKKNPEAFKQLQPYQPGNDPTIRGTRQSINDAIGGTVNVAGQEIPMLYIGAAIALVALLLIMK